MIRYSWSPYRQGATPSSQGAPATSLHVPTLWRRYWFHILTLLLLAFFVLQKNVQITIEVSPRSPQSTNYTQASVLHASVPAAPAATSETRAALLPPATAAPAATAARWKPEDFRNLTFVLDPDYARRNNVPDAIVETKLAQCKKYIERFARVAITEMEKYGVPASITLAQALLESDAGASKLALESNNHFGIKCRSKCLDCTCRNYADDDRYDMFRVFSTAWESFRTHSRLMHDDRYKHLLQYGNDYRKWAEGLEAAGYATDPQYAEKLIQIIEFFDLYLFDQQAA